VSDSLLTVVSDGCRQQRCSWSWGAYRRPRIRPLRTAAV